MQSHNKGKAAHETNKTLTTLFITWPDSRY